MPGGTKMYWQKAKNSNFSHFDDICQSSSMIIFGHKTGSCAKNYKTWRSSLFLGINGLMSQKTKDVPQIVDLTYAHARLPTAFY